MRPQIAALIASLNIGLFLPVFYANGVACYPGWIVLGLLIGLACYFSVSLLMSRLVVMKKPKGFVAKQTFSLGYYFAPVLTYLLVLLMIKLVARP